MRIKNGWKPTLVAVSIIGVMLVSGCTGSNPTNPKPSTATPTSAQSAAPDTHVVENGEPLENVPDVDVTPIPTVYSTADSPGIVLAPKGFATLPKGFIASVFSYSPPGETTINPAPPASLNIEDYDGANPPAGYDLNPATEGLVPDPTPEVINGTTPIVHGNTGISGVPYKEYIINDQTGQGADVLVFAASDYSGMYGLGTFAASGQTPAQYVASIKSAAMADSTILNSVVTDINNDGKIGFVVMFDNPLGNGGMSMGTFLIYKDDKILSGTLTAKEKIVPSYLSTLKP